MKWRSTHVELPSFCHYTCVMASTTNISSLRCLEHYVVNMLRTKNIFCTLYTKLSIWVFAKAPYICSFFSNLSLHPLKIIFLYSLLILIKVYSAATFQQFNIQSSMLFYWWSISNNFRRLLQFWLKFLFFFIIFEQLFMVGIKETRLELEFVHFAHFFSNLKW